MSNGLMAAWPTICRRWPGASRPPGAGFAWPGLLPESARWPTALAVVLLSPLLHLLLQRVKPAPLVALRSSPLATSSHEHEPMFAAAAETAPLEAMAPQELTPALYEAACHGRIDRGLQLLQAGARSEERRVGKECRSRWSP